MKDRAAQSTLQSVIRLYSTIAPHFSQTRQYVWPDLHALIAPVRAGDSVLDVGCGNGRLYGMLHGMSVQYVGVDAVPELLAEARKQYPGIHCIEDSMVTLKHVPGTYDHIFMIASLHHVPSLAMRVAALRAAREHLKIGGTLSLAVWNLWQKKYRSLVYQSYLQAVLHPFSREPRDVFVPWKSGSGETLGDRYCYAFTDRTLHSLLRQAGFEVRDVWYTKDGDRVPSESAHNICAVASRTQ